MNLVVREGASDRDWVGASVRMREFWWESANEPAWERTSQRVRLGGSDCVNRSDQEEDRKRAWVGENERPTEEREGKNQSGKEQADDSN
ncbi:hypothetical protein chiPu_0030282 [Chiloscyllium punctatum]|uniref:Uncharacterized protein n=1 Tax=Chiloscyllium punctatum TaxID=137246 RepID=A0A401TTB0_CHIPU|nr:hypothetical protein [Chiloscyllium punctatum]